MMSTAISSQCVSHPSFVLGFHPPTETSIDSPSIASTIGKAAIVVLVTFSIPLQIHPCRASIYAVTQWRPKSSGVSRAQTPVNSPPGSRALLPTSRSGDHGHGHGSGGPEISDSVFAWLTSLILIAAYATSLTVSSLERVLAFVGSIGSTSISFILPGIFYWKISHPDSGHRQRLAKEDDDATATTTTAGAGPGVMAAEHGGGVEDSDSDDGDADAAAGQGLLGASTGSIRSNGARNVKSPWRRRTKWKWNMEHLSEDLLRKGAGLLAIYGACVLVVCLTLNMVGSIRH